MQTTRKAPTQFIFWIDAFQDIAFDLGEISLDDNDWISVQMSITPSQEKDKSQYNILKVNIGENIEGEFGVIGTHFTHSFAMNMQENNDGSTLIGFDLDDYAVVRTEKPETKNTLFGYSFGGGFGGDSPSSVFQLEGNNTDSSISYDSGVTFTQTGDSSVDNAVVNFDLAQNEQLKEAFKFSAVAGVRVD